MIPFVAVYGPAIPGPLEGARTPLLLALDSLNVWPKVGKTRTTFVDGQPLTNN